MPARLARVALLFLVAAARQRSALPPRPDGAAVGVTPGTPVAEADVPFGPEAEPNDTTAAAQRLDLASAAARGVSASLHEGSGKGRDTDLYRIDVPAPDGAATPPPPPADGAAAAAPVGRRVLRVDVRPE